MTHYVIIWYGGFMKSKILQLLIDSNDYISGVKISEILNVSRVNVWKHINGLKKMGYNIESKHNKGYKLIKEIGEFNEIELQRLINSIGLKLKAYYFDEIDSTNNYLKMLDSKEDSFVLSLAQTKGRGRRGRQWKSNKGDGIYFSLSIHPRISPSLVGVLTSVSALALQRVIGNNSLIKWPNDIFIKGRKLSGILCELITEIHEIERVIIGIGVNLRGVKDNSFKSTGLLDEGIDFNISDFITRFLKEFFLLYNNFLKELDLKKIKDEINAKSYFLNKKVYSSNDKKQYTYLGIDEYNNALLKEKNGEIKKVFFGELSLKRMD